MPNSAPCTTRTDRSPAYAFLRQPSMVDFPGRMAAVFFTTGCNFACGFCHNAGLLAGRQEGLAWDKLEDACRKFRENWVNGAVITGGEPTLWENLDELIEVLHGFGFAVKLDTNGSRPDALRKLLPGLDYVAMDVKCALADYPSFVRFDAPQRIAQAIEIIKHSDTAHEFRTTVITSFHTDDQMRAIGEQVKGAQRYVLQPFVPRDDLPDVSLRQAPRTSAERLNYLRDMLADCADEVIVRGTG